MIIKVERERVRIGRRSDEIDERLKRAEELKERLNANVDTDTDVEVNQTSMELKREPGWFLEDE